MAFELTFLVLKNLGVLLRYVSVIPLSLLAVAAVYGEWDAVPAILLTFAIFLATGWLLSRLPALREPRLREGLLIAALGWLLVPLGSIVPFMLIEGWGFVDAYFEAMSAWTGTGFSIADVTALTHVTLAWRSIMQWVGGLGVIVLTLAVLARPGTGAFELYTSEGREDKLRPSILSTVRALWVIYILLSLAAVGVLLLTGLPAWHAFNHALTAISTGGMSILPGSIADYHDPTVEWVLVGIMISGAIPFVAYDRLMHGRWRESLRDEQVRAMVIVLILAIPVVWLFQRGSFVDPSTGAAIRETVFQVVSAVTTTGFQTTDFSDWDLRAKFAIMGLMLLGGAAGSTTGGIKLVRGVLLLKGALWKLERAGLPHFAIVSFRFGGQKLTRREANEEFAEAAFIFALWITLMFVSTLLFLTLLSGPASLENLLFDIASVHGNVGLSTGVVTRDLSDVAKWAFMAVMWTVRLEILPVLLLLRAILPGSRNH